MRAIALSAVMLLLMSGSVMASCDGEEQLGQISYPKNSSFFGSKTSQKLDKITKEAQEKSDGYLLLEFNLFPEHSDKKLQQYNLWLANRRVDRIKQYLAKSSLTTPIVTRIKTAAPKETRAVDILWCSLPSKADSVNH